MNKHRFFSTISFVRISYRTIWLKKWSWYKKPLKNERGVIKVPLKKNPTPSPKKRRKTTSLATFCATGVWGLSYRSNFSTIHLVLDEGFYSIVKILSNEFGNDLNCGNVWIDLILFCNEKSHFVLSLGMSPRLIPLITVWPSPWKTALPGTVSRTFCWRQTFPELKTSFKILGPY